MNEFTQVDTPWGIMFLHASRRVWYTQRGNEWKAFMSSMDDPSKEPWMQDGICLGSGSQDDAVLLCLKRKYKMEGINRRSGMKVWRWAACMLIIILCGCRSTDDDHPMNNEINVGIFPTNALVISKLYSSGVDPLTGVPFPAKWGGYLHIAGQVQYDESPGVLSYYWTTSLPTPLKVVNDQHGIYTDISVYCYGDNPQLSGYVGSATLSVWTLNGDVNTQASTSFEVVVSSPQ